MNSAISYCISRTGLFLEDGSPAVPLFLADSIDDAESEMLERYFGDLYSVFSSKLVRFGLDTSTPFRETEKLQELLTELIKVRSILEKRSRS